MVSNQTYISNFKPLEVVGSGGETQLQMGENENLRSWKLRDETLVLFSDSDQ